VPPAPRTSWALVHLQGKSTVKRQRLREKEKLKHEQYKLKECIEQLRARALCVPQHCQLILREFPVSAATARRARRACDKWERECVALQMRGQHRGSIVQRCEDGIGRVLSSQASSGATMCGGCTALVGTFSLCVALPLGPLSSGLHG